MTALLDDSGQSRRRNCAKHRHVWVESVVHYAKSRLHTRARKSQADKTSHAIEQTSCNIRQSPTCNTLGSVGSHAIPPRHSRDCETPRNHSQSGQCPARMDETNSPSTGSIRLPTALGSPFTPLRSPTRDCGTSNAGFNNSAVDHSIGNNTLCMSHYWPLLPKARIPGKQSPQGDATTHK